jgi:transcriptional regulator with PAS, ATPase and Fis domain
MKRIVLLTVFVFSFSNPTIQNIIKGITNAVNGGSSSVSNLSNTEIISGLKEALKVGTNNSTASAAKLDGFYKNPLIKIPFPKEAKQMETQLRSMGMGKEVDKFTQTLNRAAEDAAKSAAPIFLQSIQKITINDGLSILKGNNDAATQFLKNTSNAALVAAFKPIVQSSISKVQVTKYWQPLTKTYNQIPFVKKMNPDLNQYVTDKAIEGLFKLIAQEELKIRQNPTARVNDILKKVFK